MPELPEVETVCRGLAGHLIGKHIVKIELNRDGLRFPFPSNMKSIEGLKIKSINRRAKYILIELENNSTLLVHLGMTGRFKLENLRGTPEKHDHVVIHLDDNSTAVYTDPRRFGIIDLFERGQNHPLLIKLGPEPLSSNWDGEILHSSIKNRKSAIKSVLMNQHVVVGIGNIYASEILYRSGISPNRKASNVSSTMANRIHKCTVEVLKEAIDSGGSTLKDGQFVDVNGKLGYFSHGFSVYDREGEMCKNNNCTNIIKKSIHQGRSTYHCTRCQR
ncbi:MAG: bifunctional DNA-formamidopyrimidine glycosylase/DNA-(apurinic or apyrimidinic site) lyase [Candidatus Thalassarchaeaceae archaeon]|jgi:formamidopyrimidine-DNA glycosylase|nr:bifunctional DNA-formamidopyrimidine glycosylase/DNA-(apurinic or apyrimidinic site) lyase [Candidatus Thalassarchaeaceae archaeon]